MDSPQTTTHRLSDETRPSTLNNCFRDGCTNIIQHRSARIFNFVELSDQLEIGVNTRFFKD